MCFCCCKRKNAVKIDEDDEDYEPLTKAAKSKNTDDVAAQLSILDGPEFEGLNTTLLRSQLMNKDVAIRRRRWTIPIP